MGAVIGFYRKIEDRFGLGKQILNFYNKLIEDPTNPSLHVEHIANSADPRARTARVNDQYRAVLFELHPDGQTQFFIVDILNHDDAIELAKRKKLKLNPITGITELIDAEPADNALSSEEIESRAKRLAAEKLAQLKAAEEHTDDTAVVTSASGLSAAKSGGSAFNSTSVSVSHENECPKDILAASGITNADLRNELGLSAETVALIESAETIQHAEQLLDEANAWEKDAFLGLMAGMSIADIREDLNLTRIEVQTEKELDTDEAIAGGMTSDSGASEFVISDNEEELAAILSEGTFAQWRVFLHPSQKKAVKAHHSGSARVTGGAGTGKTVVVIHRTREILKTHPKTRVLLTTFTRDLANALKSQMNELYPEFEEASVHGAPGLWITGIDALASDIIKNAQRSERKDALKRNFGIDSGIAPGGLDSKAENSLWEDSVALKGSDLAVEKAHPTFLSQEYSSVILTHGITDERSYLRVSRAGRGTPLSRKERKIIWSIIEVFHKKCALNKRLTFAALAVMAADIVEHRGENRMFDHALIDEAQDFHAGHWRLIRACTVKGPDDIFLAEDSHQRIYGQRLKLAHFGINTRGRATTKLRVNYRTTAQNLAYASAILEGTEWLDSEDAIDDLNGYRSLRSGPAPEIIHSQSKSEEADALTALIGEWCNTDRVVSIGVLARTRQKVRELEAQLSDRGVGVSGRRVTTEDKPVAVMTMHNAKGLEFTHVILVDVSANALPQRYLLRNLAEAEKDDAMQRERALLYVAASRARDRLAISIIGDPSDLLPAEENA